MLLNVIHPSTAMVLSRRARDEVQRMTEDLAESVVGNGYCLMGSRLFQGLATSTIAGLRPLAAKARFPWAFFNDDLSSAAQWAAQRLGEAGLIAPALEDIEALLSDIPVGALVIYASSYLFPGEGLEYGELIAVVQPEDDAPTWQAALTQRNRRLPDFKRLSGVLVWDEEWPLTASMKVKRGVLADRIRTAHTRADVRALEAR